jgi:hypothetical protein
VFALLLELEEHTEDCIFIGGEKKMLDDELLVDGDVILNAEREVDETEEQDKDKDVVLKLIRNKASVKLLEFMEGTTDEVEFCEDVKDIVSEASSKELVLCDKGIKLSKEEDEEEVILLEELVEKEIVEEDETFEELTVRISLSLEPMVLTGD